MPFTNGQRWAVFNAHGERCWLCREPVMFLEMEVDHILPESLGHTPKLSDVLTDFGLPPEFDLNSYENLMPACRRCNGRKRDTVFRATPAIQLELQYASERVDRAREIEKRFANRRDIERAVATLQKADEKGQLSEKVKDAVSTLGRYHQQDRNSAQVGEPFRLAPWLTIIGGGPYTLTIRGPSGMVGIRPAGDNVHNSYDCPRCGPTAWNGARCISCGQFIDLD